MRIDWTLAVQVVGGTILLVIGGFLTRLFERKPHVIYFISHASGFRQRNTELGEEFWIFAHSIVLRNTGRRTAKNVRIGHRILPDQFNVFPSTDYEINHLPDGGDEIIIDQLVPREQVTISYLYSPPLTYQDIIGEVKHDDGFARLHQVLLQRQYPKSLNIVAGILTLLGAITLIYFVIAGLRALLT